MRVGIDFRSAGARLLVAAVAAAVQLLAGAGAGAEASVFEQTQLAGRSLAEYPYFEYVRSFRDGDAVEVAVDPTRSPAVVGRTCDLFVVAARNEVEWGLDATLTDVRVGGPQTVTLAGTTIQDGTVTLAGAGELSADAGAGLGVGYDIVLDCDRDGILDGGDLVDGRGDEAGLYRVHDTTLPGPLGVSEVFHDGGGWLAQKTYYPSGIAAMGELPLVVISHGWTHEYTFYDHIGRHLASYGYVVTAHTNDVGDGGPSATETASITTLTNTDYIIGDQATLAGGVLNGHIDARRIVWIGHSTGGEAVVRAHHRLRTGIFVPQHFGVADVVLVSSIAPVAWLPGTSVSPADVNYHIFIGGADIDTSGAPIENYVQSMAIYERGTGAKQLTYIHGVGHNDFHDGGGSSWAEGPDLIGRPATHLVVKGYYLPLVELYTRRNIAAKDFFTRMYDSFHPSGIPSHVVVATEYKDAEAAGNLQVDDYERFADTAVSSSGSAVTFNVQNLEELLMRDVDGSFRWSGFQGANGMTRMLSGDDQSCVVFDWSPGTTAFYELEIVDSRRDLSRQGFLSFRAAQGTRHPETVALDAPLSFSVTLRDVDGVASTIHFGSYGRITRTYPREGYGSGFGWGNEFGTVRLRLSDFETNGSGIDLSRIAAVRFEFGEAFGSARGRIGLDDVEIARGPSPVPFALALANSAAGTTIGWPTAETADSYHVYRGTIPHAGFGSLAPGGGPYDHSCLGSLVVGNQGLLATDDADPIPGNRAGFYYLVAAAGAQGHGSMGQAAVDLDPETPGDQVERPNLSPCP